MRKKKYFLLRSYSLFLILLLLWIILFEFILPSNKVLPKPSIVLQSFSSLWIDYNLLLNISSTIGIIYLSLTVGIILSKYLAVLLMEKNSLIFLVKKKNRSFWVLLIIICLFLAPIWFADLYFSKIIFAFSVSLIAFTIKNVNEWMKVEVDFIDAMRSLGFSTHIIRSKILTKLSEPIVMAYGKDYQFQLWLLVIIYEILNEREGVGFMIKKIVEYHDLSGAFALLFIIAFTIIMVNKIISVLIKKLSYWNAYE